MIPKIIHQTWKTDQVPEQWKAFAQSWKSHHPDWEYRLWSNADGAEFVEHFYPHFEQTYWSYRYDIQRADAIRYLIIYHYGGIYADLDFECLQSFESLRDNHKLVIGFEPKEHAQAQSLQEVLCNALFASKPRSKFLKAVIDFLIADDTPTIGLGDVLRTSGPVMLQNVYEQFNKSDVDAHPPVRFYPFENNAPELTQLAKNSDESERIRQKLIGLGCFAVHHWANSWTKDLAGELMNPSADSVEGFDFYPMYDSPGMDLFNGGREVAALAERCRADSQVVAFNTDGFAKHTIASISDLSVMLNANQNEGIYIKRPIANAKEVLEQHENMQLVYIAAAGPRPFSLFVDQTNDLVIAQFIESNRIWEPLETALVSKLVSPGENVIDIGANIGYFTVLFSQLVGEQGKVLAFEPEAKNYSLLKANILINRLDNVVIENQALSNTQGVADLYLSSYNKGDHRLGYTAGREKQQISSIELDQYLSGNALPIHFIKSDTQGHELKVLQGMTKLIERNSAYLCCLLEFSPGLLITAEPRGVEDFIDFFDLFETEIYLIQEVARNAELVLMDSAALRQLARIMLQHEAQDHSVNTLIFFSTNARIKYFAKMGW
ncbi:MAG: FkbM family methyltransferase [Arenicella sp.]|jgi:FkbM family methyltransferase